MDSCCERLVFVRSDKKALVKRGCVNEQARGRARGWGEFRNRRDK